MLIKNIHIRNLLSYGTDSERIDLEDLNVIIGPNGSGKSNLIETIGLLKAAPRNLSAPVKESGGVKDWLWQGAPNPTASIDAVIAHPSGKPNGLRHLVEFVEHGKRFEITTELIENERPHAEHDKPYRYYSYENGHPILFEHKREDSIEERPLDRNVINPEESILSQVKDPERYPNLTHLSSVYSRIAIYRDWTFGRYTPPRLEQKTDLPPEQLSQSGDNLALVLNNIRPQVKKRLLIALNALYPEVDDFNVQLGANRAQLFLEEGSFSIPATRLSDGTLRYLSLLAILCHPDPPPLICIEEPELGLHPDVLPTIAELLIEASSRSQIVVTTHSDILVDCFSNKPGAVMVCEKHNAQTQMRRLSPGKLQAWLKDYSLGQLWIEGEIGGKRW